DLRAIEQRLRIDWIVGSGIEIAVESPQRAHFIPRRVAKAAAVDLLPAGQRLHRAGQFPALDARRRDTGSRRAYKNCGDYQCPGNELLWFHLSPRGMSRDAI